LTAVRRDVGSQIQELVREGMSGTRIERRLEGRLNWAERDYARLLAGVRDSLHGRGGPGSATGRAA